MDGKLPEESTKKLLKVSFKWLNENASDKVGLCSDHSCIRCRLANVLFELEERIKTSIEAVKE